MTEQLPQTAPEARTALNAKLEDPAWSTAYLAGAADQKREFEELTTTITKGGGDGLAAALAGEPLPVVPNSEQRQTADMVQWFRELGIPDGATSQILRGEKVTPEELRATVNWKTAAMSDPSFVQKYLGGDAEAKRKMVLANSIIINGAKEAAA